MQNPDDRGDHKPLSPVWALCNCHDPRPRHRGSASRILYRQNVEQYFNFGKNYARFIPVRQQTMEMLAEHMLLAFIATFVVILIKNRLNVVDTHYSEVPLKLCTQQYEDLIRFEDETGNVRYFNNKI